MTSPPVQKTEPSPENRRRLLEMLLRKKAAKSRTFPLSFAQERMWFLNQWDPGSTFHNISGAVRIQEDLADVTDQEHPVGSTPRRG